MSSKTAKTVPNFDFLTDSPSKIYDKSTFLGSMGPYGSLGPYFSPDLLIFRRTCVFLPHLLPPSHHTPIHKGDGLRPPPQRGAALRAAPLCGFPYEACWQHRQGKARQTARQDQLSRAKAKQARQPSQISRPKSRPEADPVAKN